MLPILLRQRQVEALLLAAVLARDGIELRLALGARVELVVERREDANHVRVPDGLGEALPYPGDRVDCVLRRELGRDVAHLGAFLLLLVQERRGVRCDLLRFTARLGVVAVDPPDVHGLVAQQVPKQSREQNRNTSDQDHLSPYTPRVVYYFKERDSR